jgi:hypothetical protein
MKALPERNWRETKLLFGYSRERFAWKVESNVVEASVDWFFSRFEFIRLSRRIE